MASERKIVLEKVRRVLLKEFLMKETQRAGFGGIDIQRTPMGTRITLLTERPGLVIGRRGGSIKSLTDGVEKSFKFDNPQIEVQEVEEPSLNAQIMAEKLSDALERGWHFRRAGHSTVRRIMDAGARGCLVTISGKLTGQRHRTEKFKEGHIKFCGEPKLNFMKVGFAAAKLKQGVLGVTVHIMDPKAKLPDEVEIAKPEIKEVVEVAPPEMPQEKVEEVKVEEVKELEPLKVEKEEPKEKKRKGKIAEKKLKKVKAELRELGEEADVELEVGEKEKGEK